MKAIVFVILAAVMSLATFADSNKYVGQKGVAKRKVRPASNGFVVKSTATKIKKDKVAHSDISPTKEVEFVIGSSAVPQYKECIDYIMTNSVGRTRKIRILVRPDNKFIAR